MAEEVGESNVEQSAILNESEINAAVAEEGGGSPSTPTLPSDKVEFEVPDKFKDKSIEDVIKSYQELEKFQGKKEEEAPVEENPTEEPKKGGDKLEQYNKYAESYDKNGALTEAEYAELDKLGYSKDQVDAEIVDRADRAEYDKYKADKQLNKVLEPLGGGADKFEEVAKWAAGSKPAEEVKAFNDALAASGVLAQQALLKGLYSEYEASGKESDTILHTNSSQSRGNKGYTTQEEFFKDVGSPEYKNNPAYREAVEKKMGLSGDLF